jgi:predicted transcriptional regulator YdeE
MDIVKIGEKIIYGILTRTTNANEMNPETAKIGKTWQEFDNKVTVDSQKGERVYGVYFNYESDAKGEFDVLAGCEKENSSLDKVSIQEGNYLVFEAKAKTLDDNARIQAVMSTWGEVWEYFGDEDSEYKRAYKTDFEYYKNQSDIDICISIL